MIDRVFKTAARRAATNVMTRFLTGLVKPNNGPTPTKPRGPDRRVDPAPPIPLNRRPPGCIFYVALCNGFLVAEQGPDVVKYELVTNIRYATPFTSFNAAQSHARTYAETHLDRNNQYWAVVRPA